ncbi:metal ABC transporter permease [Arhodomonas aquaeolei]|uniref:metal ABC transporter permease n=1 Tax=Arhodomonas aquaeolei TaxID=2369 RepID=UPI0035B5AEAA
MPMSITSMGVVMAFIEALLRQGFLQHAAIGIALASVASGLIGPFVVVRRIGYLAGGIAHSVLGGMGVAWYFGASPLAGALVAALLAALIVGWVNLRFRAHEDMLISALWSGGMAVGIVFISQTEGYRADLFGYLFGNILLVDEPTLWLMAGLDVLMLTVLMLFYRQFTAVCFDAEFARLRGVPVPFFHILLLCLVAVTVVILVQVSGLILLIALLSLPAATAGDWVRSLGSMMLLAAGIAAGTGYLGLALAWQPDWPAGATIVLTLCGVYVLSLAARLWRERRHRGSERAA